MLQYNVIRNAVYKEVFTLIKKARGSMVSFTPAQLARRAGLPKVPAVLSVIRYVLETELGLECLNRNCHGIRYYIDKYKHPNLWFLAKNA